MRWLLYSVTCPGEYLINPHILIAKLQALCLRTEEWTHRDEHER